MIKFEETGDRGRKDIMSEGKIAVQYCIGQTAIWIPGEYCRKLGAKKILGAIEGVFTSEELNKFGSYAIKRLREGKLAVKCEGQDYYEIEIPTVLKIKEYGELPKTDSENKIPKLVQLLNKGLL